MEIESQRGSKYEQLFVERGDDDSTLWISIQQMPPLFKSQKPLSCQVYVCVTKFSLLHSSKECKYSDELSSRDFFIPRICLTKLHVHRYIPLLRTSGFDS